MTLTKEEIEKACDEAYKKVGHNAYYANGFKMGVEYAIKQSNKWMLTKDSYPIADQLGYDWEGARSELVLCEDKHGSTYVARYYGSRLGYGTWECRSGETITDVIIKWRELPID